MTVEEHSPPHRAGDGQAWPPAEGDRGQRVGTFRHLGRRAAYSVLGSGPPLMLDCGRIHHLGVFWGHPRYRRLVEHLARRLTVIRFDRLGCGLSDRSHADFGLPAELAIFDRLLDHLGIEQTAVLGMGSSALASVATAALRPRRVSRLVLFGAWSGTLPQAEEYRTILSPRFLQDPDGAIDMMAQSAAAGCEAAVARWLAEAFAEAAAADVVLRCVDQSLQADIQPLLARVRCPTLVLHRRDEPVMDFGRGRAVAAGIPGAVLVPLDGAERLPWEGNARQVVRAVLSFLAEEDLVGSAAPGAALTAREHDVVRLVAMGLTNREIAERLGVGFRTVETHVKRIRVKLGLRSRAHVAAWGASLRR